MMEHVTNIIQALGVILIAYWSYNQYAKNKLVDKKIENWKREEEEKSLFFSENISRIYGEMWHLLHETGADRVYVVQPHPLTNMLYVSVIFEVKQKGISPIKNLIQAIPIADIPLAIDKLVKRDWIIYSNISEDIETELVKSICMNLGIKTVFVKKLATTKQGWVGSLILDFMEPVASLDYIKGLILPVAESIQYSLPPYKEQYEK